MSLCQFIRDGLCQAHADSIKNKKLFVVLFSGVALRGLTADGQAVMHI